MAGVATLCLCPEAAAGCSTVPEPITCNMAHGRSQSARFLPSEVPAPPRVLRGGSDDSTWDARPPSDVQEIVYVAPKKKWQRIAGAVCERAKARQHRLRVGDLESLMSFLSLQNNATATACPAPAAASAMAGRLIQPGTPAPVTPPRVASSPRALPSVVTWQLPAVAAILLLETSPRKVVVQCHYPDEPAEGSGATEEWRFPYVYASPGRAADSRAVERIFAASRGLVVEVMARVDVRPWAAGPGAGGPCCLYRARVSGTGPAAESGSSCAETESAGAVGGAGSQADMGPAVMVAYTQANPDVDEIGIVDAADVRGLAMGAAHDCCRKAYLETLGIECTATPPAADGPCGLNEPLAVRERYEEDGRAEEVGSAAAACTAELGQGGGGGRGRGGRELEARPGEEGGGGRAWMVDVRRECRHRIDRACLLRVGRERRGRERSR